MPDNFRYDVFLSHSAIDKAVVRALAERLTKDGLRVWFDQWEIKPGDSIPSKIEEGLEHSRVLVLCMSASAFASEWSRLESGTFRFRDPLNRDRRFIPLRLDDAPIKGSLAQFLSINWVDADRDQEYAKLLEACRSPQEQLTPEREAERDQFLEKIISLGHTGSVRSVAWSPDGRHALSGADDKSMRLWEVESGRCVRVLEGHTTGVNSVAWSPDGRRALSGAQDNSVRLWEVESGRCVRVLEGHTAGVTSVAWSPDGGRALSGAKDDSLRLLEVALGRVFAGHTASVWTVAWSPDGRRVLSGAEDNGVRLWEVESGRCVRVLEGHTARVNSVAWSPDGRRALSGAWDNSVRLWEVESGRCVRVLEDHTSFGVLSVAWSPDGRRALSGADDNSVRVWEVDSGRCVRVLEGHTAGVNSVAWSPDGRRALSGAADNSVRLWVVESGRCVRVLEGHTADVRSVAWSPGGRRALSGALDRRVRLWEVESGRCVHVLEGHTASVTSVAWSPDGRRALSGAHDNSVRLWEVESGRCVRVLEGHTDIVYSVAWSPDGRRALSGAEDNSVRLWEVDSGRCVRVLKGHTARVWCVAWSPDGRRALSAADDNSVRLWEVESGRCVRVLEGHTDSVNSVAWSPDGRRALSGAHDNSVRLWEVGSGRCVRVLEGHTASVWSVAWSPDGRRALSGAEDNSVRLWEVESGRCVRVLEGHTAGVLSVAWSPDGRRALSGTEDNGVRLWEIESGRCVRVLEGHTDSVTSVAWSPDGRRAFSAAWNGVWRQWDMSSLPAIESPATNEAITPLSLPRQVQYTNAKVLLVGESGAGKTGLSKRLAAQIWEPSDSTVGAWATQWKLAVTSDKGVEREIWLWDFGGQADQRLIHQLYMDETALAVLVFDGQKEDLFETLGQWDRDLERASRKPFVKLLVAGRVDAGGLRVSRLELERFAEDRNFQAFLETSAKRNVGCEELKQAILTGINWDQIPCRTTEVLFKRLKDEIIQLKDQGRVLMRFNELRETLQLRLASELERFTDEELRAVLTLLAGPGVVWELAFGSWVLLQPERINAYAQAVIRTLQTDELQRGCLMEERVLKGDLAYESSMPRLSGDDERFVLLAMHQTLVERGLCLRQPTAKGNLLVFPSYYRRERPDIVTFPAVLVSYRFTGFLDEIYATLVVRLHHSDAFDQDQLWRYAADFKTNIGKQVGVKLTRRGPGAGDLEVYFDPAVAMEEKIIFSKYVHEHLLQHARDVERLRHYVCPQCGTPVGNREVAMERLNNWLQGRPPPSPSHAKAKVLKVKEKPPTIICVGCEQQVRLWDDMEQCFASPEIQRRVRDMQEESEIELSNQSKERALVGEVISTVALANQISREFNVSDQGIDMEIEFTDDANEATGAKVFLQLKSGDSYLREQTSDGAENFTIRDEGHARYWMTQAFPVLLVIRNSEGEVRWMEVRDWLKQASDNGKKQVELIVFEGERFDVMSVRRWRERVLHIANPASS